MDAGAPPDEDEDRDDDADSDEGPRDARRGDDGCGRCRRREVCRQGVCCPEHHIVCDGACVDPRSDRVHCGACDIGCASTCRDGSCFDGQGRLCIRGVCVP